MECDSNEYDLHIADVLYLDMWENNHAPNIMLPKQGFCWVLSSSWIGSCVEMRPIILQYRVAIPTPSLSSVNYLCDRHSLVSFLDLQTITELHRCKCYPHKAAVILSFGKRPGLSSVGWTRSFGNHHPYDISQQHPIKQKKTSMDWHMEIVEDLCIAMREYD